MGQVTSRWTGPERRRTATTLPVDTQSVLDGVRARAAAEALDEAGRRIEAWAIGLPDAARLIATRAAEVARGR